MTQANEGENYLVRLIESNARVIQALANSQAEFREDVRGILARIDGQQTIITEQQLEIRGLQTENRRILERLEQHDRRLQNLEGQDDR